jgi:hypothetical protein
MRIHFLSQLSLGVAALLISFATTAATAFTVTKASALPATVTAGQTVNLQASVQSGASAKAMIVDLEVYSATGQRVGQAYYQSQTFSAAQTRSYSWAFKLPTGTAAGHYTLAVGVFTSGWSSNVYWNGSAASFTVGGAAVNGACGSSNGVSLLSAPTSNLCSVGTASAVSGGGPWTWSCAGSNGGTTASCSASVSSATGPGSHVPAGLPGVLFVGLSAYTDQLQNWLPSSGSPWAMCYQYISSGVLPSQSWVTTWGSNFAYNYAESAQAAGCIPEFTYYQIVPTINNEGAAAEQTALKNTSIMADYYKDFTALMQQLNRFGSTAVVHVEPDMWGYLESVSGDPTQLAASVASSGDADLAGYANTVAGFGHALLHLRDLYAPNVLLAAHVSTWLWNLSTSATLNVTQIAANDAAFMTALGDWDLFFTDLSDRDAGYYQYVEGDGGAHWWDTTNKKFPNFNRLNTWAAAFTAAAQKRLVIWQIPIGNTIMDTCNNTNFHYQDNREQYWFTGYPSNQAISQLAQAGVIGLLFGAGNDGTTQYFDAAGDGVTNPAPINGNTQVSVYSDDDGGLLRINVSNYYRSGPVPLP